MAAEFQKLVRSWILALNLKLSRKPDHGSLTVATNLVRVAMLFKTLIEDNPELMDELEKKIKAKLGADEAKKVLEEKE